MKQHLFAIVCVALAFSSCGPVYVVHQDPPPQADPTPAPPEEVSYQSFYDQLAPYGQWIDDPGYGYVWMPNVGSEFKPYATNGHWVYTDEGWTWASEYPWGWAAFHYGRWFYQDGYGWMWLPGHEWAPAWVSWRNSPDYYGWAPLGPNISISVSIGGGYNPPSHYWCFVPHQYVASPQVNNYYVSESRNTTIINNTTVINNTTIINNNTRNTNITNNNTRSSNRSYAGGPNAEEVGRFSGAPLRPVSLRERNTPGERVNGGELAIYRPRVNAATAPNMNRGGGGTGNANTAPGTRPAVAPAQTQPLNNVRPANTMRYNNGYNNPNNNNPNSNSGNNNNGNNYNRNPVTGNGQPAVNNSQPAVNAPASGNVPQTSLNERMQQNLQSGRDGQNGQTTRNGQPTSNGQPAVSTPAANGQGNPNGQPADFRQRTVQPVQPQVQNGRPSQPMPAPHSNPSTGNPSTANPPNGTAPHVNPPVGNQPPRGFTRQNQNAQPMKPVVKPAPQAHPDGDKPKDKDKDKDRKEQ
jgi:hypothetical protein